MSATAATELRLVLRARGGDELALRQLLRDYEALIASITAKFFAAGLERQDLDQAARIGLWGATRDYRPDGIPFKSFAAFCIRRQVITAVKTAQRGKHGPLNDSVRRIRTPDGEDEAAVDWLAVDDRDPSALLELREQIAELGTAIRERLTDFEYVCLLGYVNDESYEAIADGYDSTTKAVDNALQRARRKLTDGFERQRLATGYCCPSCGRATVKKPGRRRPPRCVVCRVGAAA